MRSGQPPIALVQRVVCLVISSLLLLTPTASAEAVEPLPTTITPVRYKLQLTPDRALRSFGAELLIEFDVLEPTRKVVVNGAGLEISSARVDDREDAAVSHDAAAQQLVFGVPRPLDRGRHAILVRYRGKIGDRGPGLFRTRHGSQPQAEYLYTALCCNRQSRYLAPIWDDVGSKAVFELELVVPTHLDAVSTMPIRKREPVDEDRVRIVFQPTPRMTPHLFFFAIGTFERFARRHADSDVGVVVPHGMGVNAGMVLDTTVDAMTYLSDYLGRPYPLPKLDSMLLPRASGGAIANWGAIQYAQRYLSVREPAATREELQISYAIISHEVAHQWFGNLVTPRDRSHSWLTEGFAVWMENKIAAAFHPDWPSWLQATEYREAAMQLDARAVTHPVVLESANPDESGHIDTEITYDKGAQVLRMIEEYTGRQVFRAAVREYVAQHAYDSVVSRSFWKALAAAATPPVGEIGADFTEQVGVPLIQVTSTRCSGNSSTVVLRQAQFVVDASSRAPRVWHVPVSAMSLDQREPVSRIVGGSQPQELKLPGCAAVKVNVGNIGYFRTVYDARSFGAVAAAFGELAAADQLGLLHDQYALAEAGYVSFDDYLELASGLSARFDPFVNLQWVHSARALDRLYRGSAGQAMFRKFARARFGKLLRDIGWDVRPDEPAHMPLLRAALIELLGQFGDGDVQAEAARRFAAVDRHAARLPAVLRGPIMTVVGSMSDLHAADELLGQAVAARDEEERRLYWMALAAASDRQVARKVLDRILIEPGLGKALRSSVLVTLAGTHPQDVYASVEAGADALGADHVTVLLDVARVSADRRIAQRMSAFLPGRSQVHASALARVRAEILHRDEVRRTRLPQVTAWLSR